LFTPAETIRMTDRSPVEKANTDGPKRSEVQADARVESPPTQQSGLFPRVSDGFSSGRSRLTVPESLSISPLFQNRQFGFALIHGTLANVQPVDFREFAPLYRWLLRHTR
jgi:hypothetical protein